MAAIPYIIHLYLSKVAAKQSFQQFKAILKRQLIWQKSISLWWLWIVSCLHWKCVFRTLLSISIQNDYDLRLSPSSGDSDNLGS